MIGRRYTAIVASVFIEPHERFEALEVYRDRLTPSQVDEIEEAPESAIIRLILVTDQTTVVQIIEEG